MGIPEHQKIGRQINRLPADVSESRLSSCLLYNKHTGKISFPQLYSHRLTKLLTPSFEI
jgi:hypothetical protein